MSSYREKMRNYNSDENRARRKMREVERLRSKVETIMGEMNRHMTILTLVNATAEKVKDALITVSVENWKDKELLMRGCEKQIDTMRDDIGKICSGAIQEKIEGMYKEAKYNLTAPWKVQNVARTRQIVDQFHDNFEFLRETV